MNKPDEYADIDPEAVERSEELELAKAMSPHTEDFEPDTTGIEGDAGCDINGDPCDYGVDWQ